MWDTIVQSYVKLCACAFRFFVEPAECLRSESFKLCSKLDASNLLSVLRGVLPQEQLSFLEQGRNHLPTSHAVAVVCCMLILVRMVRTAGLLGFKVTSAPTATLLHCGLLSLQTG